LAFSAGSELKHRTTITYNAERSAPSMRIAIIAPGSRGDVQPYIALGEGLAEAGHGVRLVTHQNFETLVRARRLEFWPVAGDVRDIAQGTQMRERLERGNFLAVMSQMAKEAQRGALGLAEGGLAACGGVDLVLAGIAGLFVGLALAERLGLPLLQAYYIPFTPTDAYPSFLFPELPSWLDGSLLNRLSHHVARQIMWQGFRSADKLARQEVFGLQPGVADPTVPTAFLALRFFMVSVHR
jgi:hypothetical protein